VNEGTTGPSPRGTSISITLDAFTISRALGITFIAAAALLAIHDLGDGGDYAFWFAVIDAVPLASVGVLVLICSERLNPAGPDGGLLQAIPFLGVASVIASIALAVKDLTDEGGDQFWEALNDLTFYAPVALGVLIYFCRPLARDRVLGRPARWGRLIGLAVVVVSLAVALNDASDATSAVWVFLYSATGSVSLGLLLMAATLEPAGAPRAAPLTLASLLRLADARLPRWLAGAATLEPVGAPRAAPVTLASLLRLDDARLPQWLAGAALGLFVSAMALGIRAADVSAEDQVWRLLATAAPFGGGALCLLIASGGRVGVYGHGAHPAVRWLAIAAMAAALASGIKLTSDAASDELWVFLNTAISPAALGALAFAMYEARLKLASPAPRA
jgi:hypothetical protein